MDADANNEEEIADYFSEPPARFRQNQRAKLVEGNGEQLSFGAKSVNEQPKTTMGGTQGRKPFNRTKSAPRDARLNNQFSPSHGGAAAQKRKNRDKSADPLQSNAYGGGG